jgi:hypothetical protein
MGNLSKYTLSPTNVDVRKILVSWDWLLQSRPLTPLALSMFGDWFLEGRDGEIYYLNILGGDLVRIASNRQEFERLSELQENCDEWFMGELVELLVEKGITLKKGQTYGYKLLPILGGKIVPENIEPTDPVVHQSILSQTIEQVKGLPPGTRIRGITVDGRDPAVRKKWWQFWSR